MHDYEHELSPYRNNKNNGSTLRSVAAAAAAAAAPSAYESGSLMSSMFATENGNTWSSSPRLKSRDKLAALQRREKYLQKELQALLDAQSDGLLSGLQGESSNDRDVATWEEGMRSPGPGDDVDKYTLIPTAMRRRTNRRNVPLRQARQAICHVMRDLAAIKAAEVDALTADEEVNASVLARMEHWDEKRVGLDEEMKRIEHHSMEAQRATEARAETEALGSEIRGLEQRLTELRLRHKRAREEAERLENRVQAQLSSFREARVLLDKEVREFVMDPPAQGVGLGLGLGGDGHATGRETWRNGGNSTQLVEEPEAVCFAKISPKRRTYGLARDIWKAEQKQLTRALKWVTLEQEALEEGSRLWESVSDMVTAFELDLRTGLEKLGRRSSIVQPSSSLSPPVAMPQNDDDDDVKSIETLAMRMDKTIREIENSYQIAENKGWKLLLCSIGAELEAFKQGRHVLRDSLGFTSCKSKIEGTDRRGSDEFREMMKELSVHKQSAKEADKDMRINGRYNHKIETFINDDDDVDEEPDPELINARQDNYTE